MNPDAPLRQRGIPVAVLAIFVIASFTLPGVIAGALVREQVNAFHFILSLFFSINLMICYWEVCLYIRRDYVAERAKQWTEWQRETGRTPAVAFLTSSIPIKQSLSPTVWADVWATYSLFDSAYANRHSYGFNVDIANGFATLVPSVLLYVAFTIDFLPSVAAGILGAMLCWQWCYVTSVYLVSFFVGSKQRLITKREFIVYILSPNAVWISLPAVALYVSIRLIVDGDYRVLGLG